MTIKMSIQLFFWLLTNFAVTVTCNIDFYSFLFPSGNQSEWAMIVKNVTDKAAATSFILEKRPLSLGGKIEEVPKIAGPQVATWGWLQESVIISGKAMTPIYTAWLNVNAAELVKATASHTELQNHFQKKIFGWVTESSFMFRSVKKGNTLRVSNKGNE